MHSIFAVDDGLLSGSEKTRLGHQDMVDACRVHGDIHHILDTTKLLNNKKTRIIYHSGKDDRYL